MTYKQAEKLALTVPWKTKTCNQGKICWCRIIVPKTPIYFTEKGMTDPQEYYLVASGSVPKIIAKHLVYTHNKSLNVK